MYWRRSAAGEKAMYKRPTEELDKLLEHSKPGAIGEYLGENMSDLADDHKGFYYYYKNLKFL